MLQAPSSDLIRQIQDNKVWFESQGKSGSAVALSFEEHQHTELSGSVFVDATLYETNFSYSKLVGSNFSDALANGALFEGADVSDCNFMKTELVEAVFRLCKIRKANFKKAKASMAIFHSSIIEGSSFDESICTKASFRDTKISDSSFRYADLRGADFQRALLENVDFDNFIIDSRTDFSGVSKFSNCKLGTGIFENKSLNQVELRAYFLEKFAIDISTNE